jgi:hypothetical protein
MKLVRTIPAVGAAWPALLVFFCADCNQAETQEEDSAPARLEGRPAAHGRVAAGPITDFVVAGTERSE